jgi:hypothetical protein
VSGAYVNVVLQLGERMVRPRGGFGLFSRIGPSVTIMKVNHDVHSHFLSANSHCDSFGWATMPTGFVIGSEGLIFFNERGQSVFSANPNCAF